MIPTITQRVFSVADYDLAATLASGQAFRWRFHDDAWESVLGSRWVRLRQTGNEIVAETVADRSGGQASTLERGCVVLGQPQHVATPSQIRFIPTSVHGEAAADGRGRHSRAPGRVPDAPVSDWSWLETYLQLHVNLPEIISTFPGDEPMYASVAACPGLRLLRQDPWECLASFILSSTKQIVQIQQIVALLCHRFGERVVVPAGREPAFAFPSFARLAQASEAELRECKMGFRAPYLFATAKMLADQEIDLEKVRHCPVNEARGELLKFPGVGNKIADCVLLFSYGFQEAFPVDVWVMKALRELYFPNRRVKLKRLQKFSKTHFGVNAGYAQQYLFHYVRTKNITAETQKRGAKKISPRRRP